MLPQLLFEVCEDTLGLLARLAGNKAYACAAATMRQTSPERAA